ncbi:CRIB domain-containing protein RIC3 [Cajanus cajan]|uniref:CRIB domain-containing protein RIC3 n=1 Tax=Cajanus cajan TaxID=3821 RepID=UPI00098DCFD7|nr:CRIB domain-containing protein RIC3 [Cajanus cajan]
MTSGAVKGQVKGQMKGLLKGLRYISQIFDEEEENKEIQIGFPTDVKHLAHIGCENAVAATPSWMTEFKESSDQPSSKPTPEEKDSSKKVRKPKARSTEGQSPGREISASGEGTKPSRRPHSSEVTRRAPRHSSEEEKAATKQHRRKSKTTSEEKEGSSRRAPRTRRASKGGSLTEFPFSDSGSGTQ